MLTGSRRLARLASLCLLAGGSALLMPAAQAVGATHTVAIAATAGGSTATTYPAYDASVSRYALIPDPTTAGHVTVTATSSDPAATVLVDGRPVGNGAAYDVPRTLAPGDEVSVQFRDPGAHPVTQSWIYLPTGIPQ